MSSEKITVAVSPHYRGFGWYDEGLGMAFQPTNYMHPIVVSKDKDLYEVKKRLRLNQLLLLEGELDLTPLPSEEEGLSEQVDSLTQELSSEKTKVTNLTSRLSTEEGKTDSLRGELATEKGKVDTLTGEKTALETQVSSLEDEIEGLLVTIAELENGGVEAASIGETYGREELEAMTIPDLKAIIDSKSDIEYASGALKQDLVELLIGVEK